MIVLSTVFHQLNVALKSKFEVVTSRHQNKLSNLCKQQKAKTINQNPLPTILKLMDITFLHINYQQMNTLHYHPDLITIFLLDLIATEYIPSSNSFTKVFRRTYYNYQKNIDHF